MSYPPESRIADAFYEHQVFGLSKMAMGVSVFDYRGRQRFTDVRQSAEFIFACGVDVDRCGAVCGSVRFRQNGLRILNSATLY